ncbi:MAG TPA: phosphoribosyltransferase family protein [Patescibacteria group bacterium]|nr:phosphoribosyltransferase family protein [Patescibacteria group bacterium]
MAATSDFRTCARCRSASPIHSLWATTVYGGAAKDLVHRLKFERAQAAAAVIAQSLAARLPERQDWLVTFVPTAPTRRRQRGYDQAELIARRLARQIGAPYAPLLGRGGKLRQVGQGRAVRKEQMQGAFYARRSADGRHVLVVDDVVTTGGTLEATAAVLRDAGAARVSAVVFAAA